jgi:5S rRNA maturation endonuclease (ribonuclease M5)
LVTTVAERKNCGRDFGQLTICYGQQLTDLELNSLASVLGVSAESLKRLNVGWDGKAYTFPMSNDFSRIIGIRRRFPDGQKVSVKSSKAGLFVPAGLPADGLLLICEGPTDTAAALDLGFAGIGRPNCSSKIQMIARLVRGREVVISRDNDDAGKAGADKLAAELVLCCPDVRIIEPPALIKDLRQWLIAGLNSVKLREVISTARPIKVRTRFKRGKTRIGDPALRCSRPC